MSFSSDIFSGFDTWDVEVRVHDENLLLFLEKYCSNTSSSSTFGLVLVSFFVSIGGSGLSSIKSSSYLVSSGSIPIIENGV